MSRKLRKTASSMVSRLFFLCLPMIGMFTVFGCFGSSRAALTMTTLEEEQKALLVWSHFEVIRKGRLILHLDKPGCIFSGRILGIIGPSGSGKTTFLNALSGRLAASDGMKVNGKIFNVNGTALRKDETAFIYQDDSFFSQISVRETLQLAASLRLFNETSQAAIEEIIQFLALDKVADNYVGDIVNRGISGGERKRLAVACELLGTSPALLIADEPSSGLDSFQATQVLQLLKKIAVQKNVAVVCTIHQPRSSIWNVFDDIMLLGPGGHVIYHGPRDQVVPYFAGIGYPCPKDTNPAEFLIDLVSSSDSQLSPSTNGRVEIEERSRLLAQEFTNATEEGESLMLTAAQQVSQWQLQHVSEASVQKERFFVITPGRAIFRFALLLQRALRQTLRDNATNLVRIGTSTMLATIIGSIFGKSGGPGPLTSTAVSDKVTLIAHASINVAMLSMIKALQLFKRERSVVDRERSQGHYSAFEYLLAKLTAEMPVDALIGAVFGYTVHYKGRLQSSRHVFAGLLALVSCVTSSLGLSIGALFPNGDVALSVGPTLMVLYVILGAVGPAGTGDDLPVLLLPIRKASPIRWACEALCAAELRGRKLTNKRSDSLTAHGSSRRTGLRLLSLHAVGNVLRSCIRLLGSQLQVVGDVLSKAGLTDPQSKKISKVPGGDRTLAIINIPDATVSQSTSVLGRMLFVHVAVAWMGLIFNKSSSA